ncbi:MAG: P-II family nitrogen regulator [Planctomycetota bacterium]
MHMIEAIVKPSSIDEIKGKLASLGILGMTAVEVKGFGKQKGHTERYRGGRMDVGFIPKVMLKVAVKDEDLDKALEAVTTAARTGNVGDGKVFVYPLTKVIRVRTGEADGDAL